MNFDGATNNPGQGIGFIVRNPDGYPNLICLKKLFTEFTINQIKLYSLWWGLSNLSKVYKGGIIIEGDSLITLHKVQRTIDNNWKVDSLIASVLDVIKGFDQVLYKHCYRE